MPRIADRGFGGAERRSWGNYTARTRYACADGNHLNLKLFSRDRTASPAPRHLAVPSVLQAASGGDRPGGPAFRASRRRLPTNALRRCPKSFQPCSLKGAPLETSRGNGMRGIPLYGTNSRHFCAHTICACEVTRAPTVVAPMVAASRRLHASTAEPVISGFVFRLKLSQPRALSPSTLSKHRT